MEANPLFLKKNFRHVLTPIKQAPKQFDFIGFDVETYDKGGVQVFYFGGLYYYIDGKEIYEYYFNKDELIKRILSKDFIGRWIVATNLSFDYSALFYESKEWNKIKLIYRGSDLISAKYKHSNKGSTVMCDTMNFAPFSVEKLGTILGTPKGLKPDYIGKRKSKTQKELYEFIEYNKLDCKISCDFMYFMQKGVNELGGQIRITIASTSLDTFRRSYLSRNIYKEQLKIKSFDVKEFIYKGYYGGRTEVFKRGNHSNLYYYDVNSLYPSMMLKHLPNPNSVFIPQDLSINNILDYEGVSEVTVQAPNINYPILPYRKDNKLIFPVGIFSGTYNNVELRYALDNGYKIIKVHKQLCYLSKISLFTDFINDLYKKRLEYKNAGSIMELIPKLIMNSNYGKWAQRNGTKTEILKIDDLDDTTKTDILLYNNDYDIKDNFAIKQEVTTFDGAFALPILSSYISSYARIHMHRLLVDSQAYYTDTDSIITDKVLNTSSALGELKLEMQIKNAHLIKPKFYKLCDTENNIFIKMKGLNKANETDFNKVLNGEIVNKMKFSKIKESVRRGFIPNTVFNVPKLFDLHDNKRVWEGNNSAPIIIQGDVNE